MSQPEPFSVESVLPGPFFARFAAPSGSPLSVLCRGLLERLLAPQRLDELFARHAKEQYTRQLLFSSLVEVLALAVLKEQPSVRAAFEEKGKEKPWAATLSAFYQKLSHVEPALAAALVEDSAKEAHALARALESLTQEAAATATTTTAATAPLAAPLLAGYHTRILDGNALAPSQRRLKESRQQKGAPLPGKSLVLLDGDRRLVEAFFPCEDAHAQERSLLGPVLARAGAGQLWLADRGFCTRSFLGGLTQAKSVFVVRHHAKLTCEALEPWRPAGADAQGRRYFEQKVRVELPGGPCELRRVRVVLPPLATTTTTTTAAAAAAAATTWGRRKKPVGEELLLLTNLPADLAPAGAVAKLYRERWRIEGVFQELEAHLKSEVDTLAYPRAALLGFAVALLAYNALSLLRLAIGAAQGPKVWSRLSMYYLALELRNTYAGLMVALPAEAWAPFGRLDPRACARLCYELAKRIRAQHLQKAPARGPKKPPVGRAGQREKAHYSTARVLAQRKQRQKKTATQEVSA